MGQNFRLKIENYRQLDKLHTYLLRIITYLFWDFCFFSSDNDQTSKQTHVSKLAMF